MGVRGMTIESGFIFAVSLILLWIKPGPGQAAIITRSLNDGFFAGFCVAVGITFGGLVFFILSAIGAAFIADNINSIGLIFKLVGAIYLFYCGYQGLKNIESGQWTGRQDLAKRADIIKNFATGFLITMANPFAIFFFIGILPSIVPLGDLGLADIVIGSIILIYVGLMVDSLIALLASQVRESLSNKQFIKKINVITSIGFIVIGAFLLFSAITNYDGAFNL
jgi:threonine/homoserine/homoserine lactone efflux protein